MRLPRALRHAESTTVAVFGVAVAAAAITHGWLWPGLLYGGFVLWLSWMQRGCETAMGERRDAAALRLAREDAPGQALDDPYTTAYAGVLPLPEHQENP